jgi:hypothetical protein
MKQSRSTDELIIGFLKHVEAGAAVKELGRKYGFSDASSYKWCSRFGGIDVGGTFAPLKRRHAPTHRSRLASIIARYR